MITATRTTQVVASTGKYLEAIAYQHSVCGEVEYLISNGETTYWADTVEGQTLVDAKFASPTKKSPFRQEVFAPVQAKVEADIVKEFTKVKELIETTEFNSFKVITSDTLAISFFEKVASKIGLELTIEVQ